MREKTDSLSEFVRVVLGVSKGVVPDLGTVYEYRGISFNFLGMYSSSVLFSVFSVDTARLSLLEILFNSKQVKKNTLEGFRQLLSRVAQKGCAGWKEEERELFCRGRKFDVFPFGYESHIDFVDRFYRDNIDRLKEDPLIGMHLEAIKQALGDYPATLKSTHPLVNLLRESVESEYRQTVQFSCQHVPVIFTKRASLLKLELLLKMWLYQRGYLPLDEVITTWKESFKETVYENIESEKLLYLLDHFTVLTVSGLSKYCHKLSKRQTEQTLPYDDRIKNPLTENGISSLPTSEKWYKKFSNNQMLKLLEEKGITISQTTFYRKKKQLNIDRDSLFKKLIQEKQIRQLRKKIIQTYASKRGISFESAKRWLIRKVKQQKLSSYEDYLKLYNTLTLQK